MTPSQIPSYFTWENLWKALIFLAILAVGVGISYFVKREVYKGLIKRGNERVARSASKGIYYLLIAIVVLIAISSLGINLTGTILAGGIVGIILGFALQSIISNFIAGLLIYSEKPFHLGDIIEVEGEVGKVLEIGILSTRILGFDGVERRIPNEKILTSKVKNFSSTPCRRIELEIGISYDSDVKRARETILEVLAKDPYVLEDPEPTVFLESLGDYSLNLKVLLWAPTQKYFEVKREILEKILRALKERGIEIPFPRMEVEFIGDALDTKKFRWRKRSESLWLGGSLQA